MGALQTDMLHNHDYISQATSAYRLPTGTEYLQCCSTEVVTQSRDGDRVGLARQNGSYITADGNRVVYNGKSPVKAWQKFWTATNRHANVDAADLKMAKKIARIANNNTHPGTLLDSKWIPDGNSVVLTYDSTRGPTGRWAYQVGNTGRVHYLIGGASVQNARRNPGHKRNHHLSVGQNVSHASYGMGQVASTLRGDRYNVAFSSGRISTVAGSALSPIRANQFGTGGLGSGGFMGSSTAAALRGSSRVHEFGRASRWSTGAPGETEHAAASDAELLRKLKREYNLDLVDDDKSGLVSALVQGIQESADVCKIAPPICVGNLGVPRSFMPQINLKTAAKFVKSLRRKGIKVHGEPGLRSSYNIPVGKLKATQREIHAGKVLGMLRSYREGRFPNIDNNVLVVNDPEEGFYILDGHHRWATLLVDDPAHTISAVVIDAPIREVLAKALAFPGVTRAGLVANPHLTEREALRLINKVVGRRRRRRNG